MNSSLIVKKFEEWRALAQPMALVTVFETLGSTYSKAGHRILIASSGDYQGLVSGGCLEGDLAEHAARAIAAGAARTVTYDLRDDADELFGLGVGCDGLLSVLVQPMSVANGYQPFSAVAAAMLGTEPAAVATVIETEEGAGPVAGATLVCTAETRAAYGMSGAIEAELAVMCSESLASGKTRLAVLANGSRVLIAPLARVPRLLVLGGGIDAVPLVRMAAQLGWRVHVADHRPAYLERSAFAECGAATLVEPGSLGDALPLDEFDAVVVMSHHLATDEAYLRELARLSFRYIGVLGPIARRAKLIAAIDAGGSDFDRRLRGPVGLDLGADSPETIALSILAEIQSTLSDRNRQ